MYSPIVVGTLYRRYIIRHPYRGEIDCKDVEEYDHQARQEQQARNLARLIGWHISKIKSQINFVEA